MKAAVTTSLVLILLLGYSTVPSAQEQSPSAEEVARQMMGLTRQADWAGYVKLLHPEAIVEFKRMFGEIIDADPTGELRQVFFGTANAKEYEALDGAVLFQRFMANLAIRVPAFAEALKTAEGVVVGSVAEGTELTHVVYRSSMTAEGMATSRVSAITLRKHDSQWRALLSGSIEGIAARLQQLSKQPPGRGAPNPPMPPTGSAGG